MSRSDHKLANHHQAVEAYLDALLDGEAQHDDRGVSEGPVEGAQAPPEVDTPFVAPVAGSGAEPSMAYIVFKVAGLRFALADDEVNAVLSDTSGIVGGSDGPAWSLGELPHDEGRARLVDIAPLIIPPERYALLQTKRHAPGAVILIGDGRWGLACDRTEAQIRLDPARIRWRGEQGARRWLAGTEVDHQCAILDVDAVIELLDGDDWCA